MTADLAVYAAGGVVWRLTDGKLRVLLIHRTKYRDVTLPKGKVDPGEMLAETAVREIFEETGIRTSLGGRQSAVVLVRDAEHDQQRVGADGVEEAEGGEVDQPLRIGGGDPGDGARHHDIGQQLVVVRGAVGGGIDVHGGRRAGDGG